jgi:hypothetical protein
MVQGLRLKASSLFCHRLESGVEFDESLISNTLEHRGGGIRAASYEVAPKSWLPEACVWVHMETGARKIWVHSFAHCFAAEELTFASKLDADCWALVTAKSIIDRAFEQPESSSPTRVGARANYFSRIWGLTCRSLSARHHS